MKQASRSARVGVERAFTQGFCAQNNDGAHSPIEFLGRAWIDADGRPGDVALRRQHALSGVDSLRTAHKFILDCGTGLRMLGSRWAAPNGGKTPETHILVTHYHWTHPGNSVFFASVRGEQRNFISTASGQKFLGRDSLKQVFEAQMALALFPRGHVGDERQPQVQGSRWRRIVYGWRNNITTRWLNHPQGCLGFRIEDACGIVAYATDNEPGDAKLDESLRGTGRWCGHLH